VLDAGLPARFGRIDWNASGKVQFSTRSGNTQEPDETWTDWSAPLKKRAVVQSAGGRYLQVRVRLLERQAEVSRVDVPFLTDNLRAVLTSVDAKSPAQTDGSSGIRQSGKAISGGSSSKIKLSWEVDNPDKDELRYGVQYKSEGSSVWLDALKPSEVLTEGSWDWNTEDLPEGHYRVLVTASDELSNPPERVKRHQKESEVILVDNTPPRLSGVRIVGGQLVGVASDGVGPIRRLEVRVAGEPAWIPFEPSDGIFDEAREAFSFDLGYLGQKSNKTISVRVFDTAGNFDVVQVGP
jgi:hypothetical protein